jgi:hypothetical protein
MPIAFAATYYALKKPSDFDPPLNSLRNEVSPRGRLLWAVRVGGKSLYRANIGTVATWFGINVEERDSRRAQGVWNEDLAGTHQATFLAHVGDSTLPTVVTIFRDVTTEGAISYTTELRGRKPILIYVAYTILSSAAAVAFLNIGSAISRRRKHTGVS